MTFPDQPYFAPQERGPMRLYRVRRIVTQEFLVRAGDTERAMDKAAVYAQSNYPHDTVMASEVMRLSDDVSLRVVAEAEIPAPPVDPALPKEPEEIVPRWRSEVDESCLLCRTAPPDTWSPGSSPSSFCAHDTPIGNLCHECHEDTKRRVERN